MSGESFGVYIQSLVSIVLLFQSNTVINCPRSPTWMHGDVSDKFTKPHGQYYSTAFVFLTEPMLRINRHYYDLNRPELRAVSLHRGVRSSVTNARQLVWSR